MVKSAKKKAANAAAPSAETPPPQPAAFEMAPEEPAAAATRRALLHLFEQMLAQQEAVLRGDDPDAVHDFRVAVRRTRSALGQVRGVFSTFRRDRFRENFAWLAGESNHLRDTDVLLEQLPELAAEVCPENAADLEPLREFLLGERATAQQAMVKVLRGSKYRRLLRTWRAFLEKPPKVTARSAPNAERPILEVARERIYAVYRGIRKKTRAFKAPVPAEDLHQLRIDCKKLRYLLELFRSLWGADEIADVLADLKHLQDLLGEMNDLEVQKGRLLELARALEARAAGGGAAVPAATLFAMGRIAQRHERRQQVLRKDLEERIDDLTGGDTRGFFRGLRG